MKLIIDQYKKQFIHRYDIDDFPYLSVDDFPGLNKKEESFKNTRGNTIFYYCYFYENYDANKVMFFCPGIGPGHTAYLREIEEFAKKGYIVYSIDYTGCDKSSGESMVSIYEPTRDVDELLNLLKLKDIILFGHSLGGFTALNITRIRKDIKKTICMSGFVSLESLLRQFIKLNFFIKDVLKYEDKMNHEYISSNFEYLKDTADKILFIHSKDDSMVYYSESTEKVQALNNDNLCFYIVDEKGHNPDYTLESLNYIKECVSEYSKLLKNKKKEEARATLKSKSALKMTNLDIDVINKIAEFIA